MHDSGEERPVHSPSISQTSFTKALLGRSRRRGRDGISRFASWIREQVTERLSTFVPSDVPNWAAVGTKVRAAQKSVEELRNLLGPVGELAAVVLRRASDGEVAQGNRV